MSYSAQYKHSTVVILWSGQQGSQQLLQPSAVLRSSDAGQIWHRFLLLLAEAPASIDTVGIAFIV